MFNRKLLLHASVWILPVVCLRAQQRSLRHYALVLEDPAVGERFASRDASHSPAAEAYRTQVRARQADLERQLSSRRFSVAGAVDTLANAVFVATTPGRVGELTSLPGVRGVIEMRRLRPRLSAAITLANAPLAWSVLGGQSNAGAGIKIGVIGSGIDQNHPAFQDPSLPMPEGFPKCTTNYPADCSFTNHKVIVARSYVRQLSVGSSSDPTAVANDSGPDDYSPRDRSGEGTAIASVIAGNQVSGPAVPFSGMAPKAWLGNYRVENSPGMPGGAGGNFESVYIQALEDAVNDGMQIVNLSAGTIALYGPLDTGSACGQSAGVPCDLLASTFEKAAQMGTLITVASGDDGENAYGFYNNGQVGYNLISSPASAPSVIAVGATMNSHILGPSVSLAGGPSALARIPAQMSDAYSADIASGFFSGAASFPVVDAASAGNDGFACAPLPAFSLYNAVALIEQGNCTFNKKASNAADAGAVGIIFYMNTGGAAVPVETQDTDGNVPLFGPIVMLAQSDGQNLKSYLDSHPGSMVLIDPAGTEVSLTAYNQQTASLYPPGFQPAVMADQLLAFSSPGPVPGSLALKPDMVATGGFDTNNGPTTYANTIALQDYLFYGPNGLYMATQSFDPSAPLYSSNGYIAASGTSFSAPMVAGAAALLMQLHPDYNAGQIKALLMNTASQDTFALGDDFGDNVDALNAGAGRLDVGTATQSPLFAQVLTTDGTNPVSISFGAVTSLPVSKQIVVTNLGAQPVSITAETTVVPADAGGLTATGLRAAVSPPKVTILSGTATVITLTLTGRVPPADEYTGTVTITGGPVPIHVPFLVLVPSGIVNDVEAIQFGQVAPYAEGSFETTPNSDGGPLQIKLIDASGVPVANFPVSFAVSPPNSATLKSVSGHPACSPDSSGASVTCKSDSYGIAWAEVFGGPSPGAPTVTATAAGFPVAFTGAVIDAPKITGITESAAGSSSIAAGSYISIYGTSLASPGAVGNNTLLGGDAPRFLPYPMNLDGVSVSFDIPGAYDGKPADYNGAPAFFTFVGQAGTQLNIMVPWELQGANSALVKVTVDGIADSNVFTVPLVPYAPQLFQAGGIAAAIDSTTYAAHPASVSAANPAHAGDAVQLYGNGLGPVNNQPASGAVATFDPLPSTKSPCTVTVGGRNAVVSYCGLASFPAEYQINITVPSGLAPGNQPVVLTVGGVSSKAANLPVQ